MTPATTAVTIALLNTFKEKFLSLFTDIADEVKHSWDDGVTKYIDTTWNKFKSLKPFHRPFDLVDFYDIYYPIPISNPNEKTEIEYTDLLAELIKNSNCINIIGNAGSGKTMIMRHLFLECLNTKQKLPIFLELRSLNDLDIGLTEYIQEKIFNFKLAKGSKILERLLNSGMFLFLLDGYDEIYSKKINNLTENLDTFIDKYRNNTFIISSRPGSGLEHFSISKNYYVQSLSITEIESFIDKVTSEDQKSLAAKIKHTVAGREGERFRHYLSNPLLLSMFILTYENFPELPNKISRFYWNVFDTLATKHDLKSKRGLYQHERKTLLKNDEIQEILRWFAYVTLFEGKFSFDGLYISNKLTVIKKELSLNFEVNDLIYDLVVAIGILLIDGMSYSFHHRSLQEYFASELIAGLEESKAARVYREKIPALILSTTDGLANFFNLCLENDERNFSRLFLLFHLQNLKEVLTYERNQDNVAIFFERSEYTWHFTPNDPYTLFCKNNPIFEVYKDILLYLGHDEANSILGFHFKIGPMDIELLYDIATKDEVDKKITYETGMFDINVAGIYEYEIVQDFVSKFQIVSILQILEKRVDSQIQRLNKYLSKSDTASNSLLGF